MLIDFYFKNIYNVLNTNRYKQNPIVLLIYLLLYKAVFNIFVNYDVVIRVLI